MLDHNSPEVIANTAELRQLEKEGKRKPWTDNLSKKDIAELKRHWREMDAAEARGELFR